MKQQPQGLWRHPDFMRLWVGQTISKLGSEIGGMALGLTAILVLKATPAQMGLISAAGAAPVLVIGLLAGVWVDRVRRRPVLIFTDIGRAVLMGLIALAALSGMLRIEQLYLAAALTGILTVFFEVAHRSYLPSLVERQHILEGNSKLEASSSVAEIGGTGLAGFLVQLLTAPVAIALDALSFLASALSIGLIRKPEPPPDVPEEGVNILAEVREGLSVLMGHPLLWPVAASFVTHEFFGSFFGTLYGLFCIREMGLSPTTLGLLIAAGSVGALPGAFLADRFVRRFGIGATLIGSLLWHGSLGLLVPLAGGPKIVAIAFLLAAQLLGDFALVIYFINEVSLRQTITPDRLMGRTNASMDFLARGTGLVGALLAGVLGELIGLRLTLLAAVSGTMLAAGWLIFSPVRHLKDLPESMRV